MALMIGRRADRSSAGRIALSLSCLLAGAVCLAVAFLSAPLLGAGRDGPGGRRPRRRRDRARLPTAGRLAAQVERMSGEIDLLSRRLLAVEQRGAPAAPVADLQNGLSEVTAEIGLLGGIVRELAVAVAAQDEDLIRLKAGIARPPPRPRLRRRPSRRRRSRPRPSPMPRR